MLLIGGLTLVSGNHDLSFQTIFIFILFSLISGGLASVFYLFKNKTGFIIFISGLVIGFSVMFYMFIDGMDGWGDLAGLMSLFSWSVIGLIAGSAVQLILYFYKKFKEHKK
jgi:hypothetical protein